MPRSGSTSLYSIPPGTEGVPDTTIESNKYNSYIHDVETDLNTPRPVVAGGTGANNANNALGNLGGEKSSQKVDNYDIYPFLPGSFYSDATATGGPAPGVVTGWAVSSDLPQVPPLNQNVFLHARSQSTSGSAGRLYIREKVAGVWSDWTVDKTGVAAPSPPVNPPDGTLWWDNTDGQLYISYNDGDTTQWVIASPVPDPAQYLLKAGDQMEGTLVLMATPVNPMEAANKQYVDDAIAAAIASFTP
jgi:hypothetical protein